MKRCMDSTEESASKHRDQMSVITDIDSLDSQEFTICVVAGGNLSNSQYFMQAFRLFCKEISPSIKLKLEILNPADVKLQKLDPRQLVKWCKKGNAHFILTHVHQGKFMSCQCI